MVKTIGCTVAYSKLINKNYVVYITKIIIFQPVSDGLRQLLIWLKDEYGNPPLIITENGYGDNGQLDDLDRINYMKVVL